ncbi:hypothetical protein BC834DRAFT_972403 [Gloeopeniophorella convolvens]|nr:hypothetical protein BC834DRAFT_972403 [Gloeopeniophorella convolvens]
MSLPHSDYDPHRHLHTAGVCGLFSLDLWTFFDAAILSAHTHPPYGEPGYSVPVHTSFVDWAPPLRTLLGMQL